MAVATSPTENQLISALLPANSASAKNYYFSASSKLRVVEPDRRVRRPGGIRLSVVYDTSSEPVVQTKDEPRRADGWKGLTGNIVSGADFLLYRADSVLELDGRFTISATDGTLINASYRGLIDLYQKREQRELSTGVDRPRHVVALALRGVLPDLHERARKQLEDIGDASRAAALDAHIMGECIRGAGDRYKSTPAFHSDEMKKQTIDEFSRLVESIATTTEVRHDEMRILDGVADAIAKSLPRDGAGVQEEGQRAAAEANLRGLGDRSWGHSAHEKYVLSASVEALTNSKAIKRLGEALGRAFGKSGDQLVAHELGKAITNAYRSEEFVLYEDVITRSSVDGESSIELTMPIWFEAASGPWSEAPGEDTSWVGERFRFNESRFWEYRELVRRPFVARGTLSFETPGIPGWPPQPVRIEFDVFDLRSRHTVFDLSSTT